MFNTSIKRAVTKAIGQRIKVAQKNYDQSVKELKAQKSARQSEILAEAEFKLSQLNASHETSKGQLLETTVTSVLTKLV